MMSLKKRIDRFIYNGNYLIMTAIWPLTIIVGVSITVIGLYMWFITEVV